MPRSGPAPRLVERAAERSGSEADGVWELVENRVVRIAGLEARPPIVLVPSEEVLMLAVSLPPISVTRRREALRFAIEDRIAEPLGEVHVALGTELGAGIHLAGVVRHDVMRLWLEIIQRGGLGHAALVPDALTLPVPEGGSWSISLSGGRACVRAADATGFAVPRAGLEAAWELAGRPACASYGEPLPPPLAGVQIDRDAVLVESLLADRPLDLRQGIYAAPRAAINPLWRRAALVTVAGLLAHGLIAAADTAALRHTAAQRQAEARALAATLRPGMPVDDELSAALDDDEVEANAQPGAFRPLLWLTANSLSGGDRRTGWRSLSFDGDRRTLSIDLDSSDPAELSRAADALTRTGAAVQSEAAGLGRPAGRLVVRAP